MPERIYTSADNGELEALEETPFPSDLPPLTGPSRMLVH